MINELENGLLPAAQRERVLTPAIDARFRTEYPPSPFPETAEVRDDIPLSQYVWILNRHRWKILSFIAASVLAAYVLSARITPVYESTATIEIDRELPPGVIGEEAARAASNDADQFLATQIKILQADSVLRPVEERYHLLEREKAQHRWFWFTSNPGTSGDGPIVLKNLRIVRPPNTYLLQTSYRSEDPKLAANAANAITNSYLEHTFQSRLQTSENLSTFMEKQLDALRARMERSSMALGSFERQLGVINPEDKTNILSARLLQLNTEFTAAQADRVKKEAASNSQKDGAIEAAQVSAQGDAFKQLIERLNEAEEKFAEIKVHFGANHPEYRKQAALVAQLEEELDQTKTNVIRRTNVEYQEASAREGMLKKAVAMIKAEYDHLNAKSFEYQGLKREADADKKLYDDLERRIKEAGINANFQNSATHIADLARPAAKPVYPNIPFTVLMTFFMSALLAAGTAILHDVTDDTIRDPEEISSVLKASFVGALPVRRQWRRGIILPKNGGSSNGDSLDLVSTPSGSYQYSRYDEAVRIMRSSILLASLGRTLKSVLVTSALPGEGKTATAVQLATAHAEHGLKTLLIDGDLRRPMVHRLLGITPTAGLAEVLDRSQSWRDVVVTMPDRPDLHVLASGVAGQRTPDLIGHGLPKLLDEASREYDLIVIDSPPLLGFAEPLQMATAADGVLVIARAGKTSRKAVSSVLNTLNRLRANTIGVVLNQITDQGGGSGYYYSGHYKSYENGNHKPR